MNPANASFGPTFAVMGTAARSLKLSIETFKVRKRSEFERVFDALAKARVEALVIQDDTVFGEANADELAALALRRQLLAVGGREFALAGGAIGFGRTDAELYRRGAYFVDRILRGAGPAELPVEQATRFELVVNLRVTRALGIGIPQPVLLRADRVIEQFSRSATSADGSSCRAGSSGRRSPRRARRHRSRAWRPSSTTRRSAART